MPGSPAPPARALALALAFAALALAPRAAAQPGAAAAPNCSASGQLDSPTNVWLNELRYFDVQAPSPSYRFVEVALFGGAGLDLASLAVVTLAPDGTLLASLRLDQHCSLHAPARTPQMSYFLCADSSAAPTLLMGSFEALGGGGIALLQTLNATLLPLPLQLPLEPSALAAARVLQYFTVSFNGADASTFASFVNTLPCPLPAAALSAPGDDVTLTTQLINGAGPQMVLIYPGSAPYDPATLLVDLREMRWQKNLTADFGDGANNLVSVVSERACTPADTAPARTILLRSNPRRADGARAQRGLRVHRRCERE